LTYPANRERRAVKFENSIDNSNRPNRLGSPRSLRRIITPTPSTMSSSKIVALSTAKKSTRKSRVYRLPRVRSLPPAQPWHKLMIGRIKPQRWSSMSIGLHWLMLVLIAAVYSCILLSHSFAIGSAPREFLKASHFMLGFLVLILVALRVVVRLRGHAPLRESNRPHWQKRAAEAMQWGLYALMIIMPLAGWLLLSARGSPIPFFGLDVPALVLKSRDLEVVFKAIHGNGGWIGYWLIGSHAAAALVHHFILRDDTLRRMLPARLLIPA
jgi:cytochrome b561